MKRSPAPKRRKPMRRRTRLAPVNRKRRAKRLARDFGPQAQLCRESYCAKCGSPPPSDPHHEPPRGAGGRDSETVPLCRACHRRRHQVGPRTFWDRETDELGRVIRDMRHAVALEAA